MSTKISINLFILVAILLILSTSACLGRNMIRGQVQDGATGKPIEKAVVHIYWGKAGSGPPGLAAAGVEVEVAEDMTDAEGYFKVPQYSTLFYHYYMTIYKKGYVCWSRKKIFPTWEERKDFELEDGMVIKMKPFKEEYSKEDHARFTVYQSIHRKMPGLFDEAIKSEKDLNRESLRRNRRN